MWLTGACGVLLVAAKFALEEAVVVVGCVEGHVAYGCCVGVADVEADGFLTRKVNDKPARLHAYLDILVSVVVLPTVLNRLPV